MSDLIIRVRSTHGITAGMVKQVSGPKLEEIQEIQEELIKEVQKMPKKLRLLFMVASATILVDGMLSGGVITAAAGAPGAAEVVASVSDLAKAFDPIKELLIAVADPICYVMFVWGCIECIVGRVATGMNRMKYAAIGFIAINWIPVIMDVIRHAGSLGRGM